MDFLKICFEENNSIFIKNLEEAGITGDLANQFLPETGLAILHIIKNTSLDKVIEILLSSNSSQLLKLININEMAEKLAINTEQVSTGLEAISPTLLQVFSNQSDEIVYAIASLAWKTSDELTVSDVKRSFE